MSEQNNGKFVKAWFYHGVKVSKWENVNGERKSVSFSIEKSYKDKAGEYQKSKTFFSDDLDALIQCLISAKQESVKVILPKTESDTTVQESVPEENVPF